MHNPWDGKYQLVCDWTCHVTRTPPSSGGDDYAMNTGTPIIAAFDGVLTNRPPVQYPASGNTAILTRADGLAFYHLHLSRFVAPGPVKEGDIIAYSGSTGHSTGPHLHVNAYYQGAMRDVHDFYSATTAPAGTGDAILIPVAPPKVERHDMIVYNTGTGFYLSGNGRSVEFNDATINGQQITAALSAETVRRAIYDNNEGKLTLNVEEAAIVQYWVFKLAEVDTAALSTAISTAVVAALPAGISVTAIASAVDAVLADNFAAIPKSPTVFIAQ